MKTKKVYIAKRIPKNPPPHLVLNIDSSMSVKQIYSLYVEKTFVEKNYIYNGPWILRPPLSEKEFSTNQLPSDLKPIDIWNMVKEKIESSNVVLGIINNKAYGTIAEVSYACNQKETAVYVLPDRNISMDKLQDLWFLFQICKTTKQSWANDDIKNIKEFAALHITSLQEYEKFLETIVPNFMKR